jgi:hypothetical protein
VKYRAVATIEFPLNVEYPSLIVLAIQERELTRRKFDATFKAKSALELSAGTVGVAPDLQLEETRFRRRFESVRERGAQPGRTNAQICGAEHERATVLLRAIRTLRAHRSQ